MRAGERRTQTNPAMDAVEGYAAGEERAQRLAAKHTTGKTGMRVCEVHFGTAKGAHVALPLCTGELAQVPPEVNRVEGRIALGEKNNSHVRPKTLRGRDLNFLVQDAKGVGSAL
jgi:hypothetical protein